MREFVTVPLSLALGLAFSSLSAAQELTPNPGAWRPLVVSDLKSERPDNLTYLDIWKDAIVANNQAFDANGGLRADGDNAPAREAHVVVRSPQRTVVLTTLDSDLACRSAPYPRSPGARIKLCPTRVVAFEGALSRVTELPLGCFLEIDSAISPAPDADASFAAYDTATKTIKIGLVLDHKVIDECARFVPIAP